MKEAEQMSLQYPDVLYRVMDKTGTQRSRWADHGT